MKAKVILILIFSLTEVLVLGSMSAPKRPNIILISLDQLRADRLHSYGNCRETSPNLDRIAAEGVIFKRFYASSPWTTPSYASIMTGQHPSRHGATLFHTAGAPALKPGTVLVAELLKEGGYQTAAFINNSNAGAFLTRSGFDEYDEAQRRPTSITERSSLANREFTAPATTERVEKWLEQKRDQPFFLFLLYFEPHSPYDPSPEHDLFRSDAYPEEINRGYDIVRGRLFRLANLGDRKAVERQLQLYDGKIHFVDRYIGRLLEKLLQTGLEKETIVWVTSDHGELIYAHPDDYLTFDHRSLYQQVLHVPGLLRGPGIPKGRIIEALASHIDIAPTLLEFAGLPPKADAQGQSLAPLIKGRRKSVHRYVFSEQDVLEPLRAVQDERFKLIWNIETGRKQLFDHRSDYAEQHDVLTERPGVARQLMAELQEWRRENESDTSWRDGVWREHSVKRGATLVVDEVTPGARFHLTGKDWRMVDGASFNAGGAYWTPPSLPGEAPKLAFWRADNPLLGKYRISIWYGELPQEKCATNVPLRVTTALGSTRLSIDQSRLAGQWQELGLFDDPRSVSITNEADGVVIADAVKFERVP